MVGGTTTLIEMCCPSRFENPLEAFDLWRSKAEGRSACDYTFHMGVSRFDDTTADQLQQIVDAGIFSLKIFLAYQGFFGIDDTELFRTLQFAKESGLVVTAHCENETAVAQLQSQLLAAGQVAPRFHEPSRPPVVEAEGVHHLMTFAELTGAHVYCVHTSCEPAVRAAEEARRRGGNVWTEVVIPHLVLDQTATETSDFEGAKYVMSPPLRDKKHQSCLWTALRNRVIHTVATDHAPFDFVSQKEMGQDDFTKIPNGIPSVEDRINLLYTYGVKAGRIDLNTLVDAGSTQAAKLFGLYPRKGTIQPGSDADLVVYDPDCPGSISAKTHHMNVDYSAFEGWDIAGRPEVVTVRGKVQVQSETFTGDTNYGQFLQRSPNH